MGRRRTRRQRAGRESSSEWPDGKEGLRRGLDHLDGQEETDASKKNQRKENWDARTALLMDGLPAH